jgi:hypothetical protein
MLYLAHLECKCGLTICATTSEVDPLSVDVDAWMSWTLGRVMARLINAGKLAPPFCPAGCKGELRVMIEPVHTTAR